MNSSTLGLSFSNERWAILSMDTPTSLFVPSLVDDSLIFVEISFMLNNCLSVSSILSIRSSLRMLLLYSIAFSST